MAVELLGGALTMLGGASLCASGVALHAIERARALLGDTDAALPTPPDDMLTLLDGLSAD